METSQEKKTIHAAMIEIMRAVEAIKKEKTNTQGASFKYRGIDDVMNSLHNAFADAGVFITTEVLERSEKERQSKQGGALFYITSKIRFTFHAEDGSSISSTVIGTAMDSGDKADNKCLSIGLKYALLQAFLIPTEDMAEPDGQTHEVQPQQQPQPFKKIAIDEKRFQGFVDYLKAQDKVTEAVTKVITDTTKRFTFTEPQAELIQSIITEKTTAE